MRPALLILYDGGQSLDPDYLRAFAPGLLDDRNSFYSTATIIPLEKLYQDQIAFLREHGARDVLATERVLIYRVDTREEDGLQKPFLEGTYADINHDHYICAFSIQTIDVSENQYPASWEVFCYTAPKEAVIDQSA